MSNGHHPGKYIDTQNPPAAGGDGNGVNPEEGYYGDEYPELTLVEVDDTQATWGVGRIYYKTIDYFPAGFNIGGLGTTYKWVMIAATASGGPLGIWGTNTMSPSSPCNWTYIGLLVGIAGGGYHHTVIDMGAGNTPNGSRFCMFTWNGNANVTLPNWGTRYESNDLVTWSNATSFLIPDPNTTPGSRSYSVNICWGLSKVVYNAAATNAGQNPSDYTLWGFAVCQYGPTGAETPRLWVANGILGEVATVFTWQPVTVLDALPSGDLSFAYQRSWFRTADIRPGFSMAAFNVGTSSSSEAMALAASADHREFDTIPRTGLRQLGHSYLDLPALVGALAGVVPTRVGPVEIVFEGDYVHLFVTWRGDLGAGNLYYLVHAIWLPKT